MLKTQQQRPNCWSVRTRRSESVPPEQAEADGRNYRTLLSILANNINAIVKTNRNCLGEIDTYSKIKTSREENQVVLGSLEKIYPKMQDKIMKDAVSRNSIIKKSIEDYTNSFKTAFPGWLQNRKIQESSKNETLDTDPYSKNNCTQRKPQLVNVTPKRPVSSKQSRQQKTTLFNQIYQNFQSNAFCQTYKIKTITAHANENPQQKKDFITVNQIKVRQAASRIKRASISHNNRYEQKQNGIVEFQFHGQEIMINQRKFKDGDKNNLQLQNTPFSNKQSAKRMVNLKFTQRKSINEIQKMQIQNRIMLINSALSVNLAQSQGYRPKSRCWQNYFN